MLPFSHDEVVHGKGSLLDQMPGDVWQKFANLRLLFTYMWTHPGKKLNFMGNEWGQWNEWNCDEALQWELLEWDTHKGLKQLVSDLNRVYLDHPALYDADFDSNGFEWIDCQSRETSSISYLRRTRNGSGFVVVSCNFTPVVREGFRIGVPEPGSIRRSSTAIRSTMRGPMLETATRLRQRRFRCTAATGPLKFPCHRSVQ